MKNIFVSKLLFQEQVSAPAGEQLEVVAAVCSAAVLQSPAQLQQLQQVEAVLQWTWWSRVHWLLRIRLHLALTFICSVCCVCSNHNNMIYSFVLWRKQNTRQLLYQVWNKGTGLYRHNPLLNLMFQNIWRLVQGVVLIICSPPGNMFRMCGKENECCMLRLQHCSDELVVTQIWASSTLT